MNLPAEAINECKSYASSLECFQHLKFRCCLLLWCIGLFFYQTLLWVNLQLLRRFWIQHFMFSTCQLANLDVLKLAGLPHLSYHIKKAMRRLHLVLQQNTGKPCSQLTHLRLSLYRRQLPCHLHVRVWHLISKLGHQKCLRLEQQPSESTDIMHGRQGTQNVCCKPGKLQFCNWRPRLANTKCQPPKCRIPRSDQWLPGPGTHANFLTSLLKMSFAVKNWRHGNRRKDIRLNCEVVKVKDVQKEWITIVYGKMCLWHVMKHSGLTVCYISQCQNHHSCNIRKILTLDCTLQKSHWLQTWSTLLWRTFRNPYPHWEEVKSTLLWHIACPHWATDMTKTDILHHQHVRGIHHTAHKRTTAVQQFLTSDNVASCMN